MSENRTAINHWLVVLSREVLGETEFREGIRQEFHEELRQQFQGGVTC